MTLPLTSYRGLASAAGGCSRPFVNRAEPVRLVCVCVCVCLSNYVLCVCVSNHSGWYRYMYVWCTAISVPPPDRLEVRDAESAEDE